MILDGLMLTSSKGWHLTANSQPLIAFSCAPALSRRAGCINSNGIRHGTAAGARAMIIKIMVKIMEKDTQATMTAMAGAIAPWRKSEVCMFHDVS